ncbi:DUF1349 domain-containing protein [Micromonospora arborensis]|uniref:DUF1349 domain-containing protein n=1 Tax=Micromonospora arborensis TaxID=2116518 RepID=UPI003415B78C
MPTVTHAEETSPNDHYGKPVRRLAASNGYRARADDEPWRLVRLTPLDPTAEAMAGPFCCAPSRAGLSVVFTGWRQGPADTALHPEH